MKKIAVLISGCGHRDGSEITEAVSLLIGLAQNQAQVQSFSLNMDVQAVNHLTGKVCEMRNLLTESARILRGEVRDLAELKSEDYDAFAIVGGQGVSKQYSTWAEKKSQAEVQPLVQKCILDFHRAQKPIGAICAAPVVVALSLRNTPITITLGMESETSREVQKLGCYHVECPSNDYVTDRDYKIISTPAYMNKSTPDQVFAGISGLCKELLEMS